MKYRRKRTKKRTFKRRVKRYNRKRRMGPKYDGGIAVKIHNVYDL